MYDRWGNRTQVWNATTGGAQIQQVNLALSGSVTNNHVASYWDQPATGRLLRNVTYDAVPHGGITNDGAYTFNSRGHVLGAQLHSPFGQHLTNSK